MAGPLGQMREFPEVDRAAWFDLESARAKLVAGQVPFIDLLTEQLGLPSSGSVLPDTDGSASGQPNGQPSIRASGSAQPTDGPRPVHANHEKRR